ncbi:MAG: hypothetical protein ABIZ81_06740, partial [Opitutaceae bacterium]
GEVPHNVAAPVKPDAVRATPAEKPPVAAKPKEPKPSNDKAAAPKGGPDDPSTMYGKMVKKARDSEAQHKENLVDPVDRSTSK